MRNRVRCEWLTRLTIPAIAAVTLAAGLSGCVKRGEIITVFPDGAALLLTQVQGDPGDVAEGDPLPTEAAGWQVSERIETDNDGKRTLNRVASRRVLPRAEFPSTYAAASDPKAPYALRFPTSVTIERRPEGTYYHFRRVYEARPWWRVQYWRKQFVESDELKRIGEKPPAEVTTEERTQIAQALIGYEAAKTLEFLDDAYESLDAPLSQHVYLEARQRVADLHEQEKLLADSVAILEASGRKNDTDASGNDAGAEFEALEQRLRANVVETVGTSLAERRVPAAAIDRLLAGYRNARTYFDLTDDLSDEDWTVIAVLPGTIVAHNSRKEAPKPLDLAEVGDSEEAEYVALAEEIAGLGYKPGFMTIQWSFDAEALHDRHVSLMATSFVPAAP